MLALIYPSLHKRGWLGGGSSDSPQSGAEQKVRAEALSMRSGLCDKQRQGVFIAVSPDRRLAAFADSFGRVAVLDVTKGHLVRLFKGYRDAQCAFLQVPTLITISTLCIR